MAFGAEEITARLAEFAVTADMRDWPAGVKREALRSFFNIVGVTVGGARHEMVDIAFAALDEQRDARAARCFMTRGASTNNRHAHQIATAHGCTTTQY